jgi:hypothetical protein
LATQQFRRGDYSIDFLPSLMQTASVA